MRGSLIGAFVAVSPALLAAVWTVRVEEPTGIYRRTAEVVRIQLSKLGASRTGFRVADDKGRYGDAHAYHGWYDGSIWEYTAMPQPFVSELGATSLPNYEWLMRFSPAIGRFAAMKRTDLP